MQTSPGARGEQTVQFQFTPLLIVYVLSAVVTAALGVYGLQRLRRDGRDPTIMSFLGIVFGGMLWGIARFFELLFVSQMLTKFWIAVLYIGYGSATISAVFFGLAFTGRTDLVTRRTVALLFAFPVIAVLAAATNEIHHLLWTGTFDTVSGWYGDDIVVYVREFQPPFFFYFIYTTVGTLIGIYLLVRMGIQSADIYRRQTFAFGLGGLAALAPGVLFALEAMPVFPPFLDLTPAGFTVMGLCYAYAIFRYQLLDLVPVARDTVVESMRDGYVVLDTDNRIADLNSAAMEAVEADESVIGSQLEDALPACSSVVAAHEQGSRLEEEIEVEIDGEQRFLFASVSSLHRDDRLIGRLLLLRDVTDRRAVQKRYQALIENSTDLIVVVDDEATISYMSPSVEDIVGFDPETMTGQDAFDFIHHEDEPSLRDAFERVREHPDEQARQEFRACSGAGSWLYLEASIRNLQDNPYVEGIVVNAREITERKRREQELKATNDQLTQANERLEQFAGVVSHDLRNPINVARGHLDIACETGNEDSFETIDDSLQRMEAVIDDVLTLARQGDSIGETAAIDLEETAQQAWRHVATGDAELVVEGGTFEADPDRILQLFENLFRNTVEHGGDTLTVRVGVEDGTLYVEDDGEGIPEDERDDVLESGYTTNQDGTGLGLSIVTQIADAHGWSVTVTESEAGGARFEFGGLTQTEVAGESEA